MAAQWWSLLRWMVPARWFMVDGWRRRVVIRIYDAAHDATRIRSEA